MSVKQAPKPRKAFPKWHGASACKYTNSHIRYIGGAVSPATELLELCDDCLPKCISHYRVLIDRYMNRNDAVVSIVIKITAPILMTILNNAALTPIINFDKRRERLAMSRKITKCMRAHTTNYCPNRVTSRKHSHRCWRIPNITKIQRNWLI